MTTYLWLVAPAIVIIVAGALLLDFLLKIWYKINKKEVQNA
jgi:hypothetical protein